MMCAQYFINRWLQPMMTKKMDERKVAAAEKTMVKCLDEFEGVWLRGGARRWVAGAEQISVADILAACELEQPSMAGYTVTRDRAVLADYVARYRSSHECLVSECHCNVRVKQELSPHYDDISAVVYKMRDRYGGDVPGVFPADK